MLFVPFGKGLFILIPDSFIVGTNDHHGVGIKLGRLMKEQYGPAMQVFEGIKKSLDPNGIMNPYKLGL